MLPPIQETAAKQEIILLALSIGGSIGVLLLGAAWAFRHWRDPRAASYALLGRAVLGVSVISLGGLLQPTLWALLNFGVISMEATFKLLIRDLNAVVLLLQAGAFPGIATGVATLFGRSMAECLFLGALVAIGALTLQDLILFVLAPQRLEWILFSMFSNMTGGALGGAIVAYLSTLLGISRSQVSSLSPLKALRMRRALVGLLLAAPIFFLGVYFVFIYHLPERVLLQLSDWKRLALRYEGPMSEWRHGSSIYTLPLATKSVLLGPVDGELIVTWGFELPRPSQGLSPRTHLMVAAMGEEHFQRAIAEIGRGDLDALLQASQLVYKEEIAERSLRIAGRSRIFTAILHPKVESRNRSGFELILPSRQWIELSRDPRAVAGILVPDLPAKESLTVQALPLSTQWQTTANVRGLRLRDTERVVMVLRESASLGRNPARFEIIVNGREAATEEHPVVLIVLGADDGNKWVDIDIASSLRLVSCRNCEVKLRAFRVYEPVLDGFTAEGARGRIEVGLLAYDLTKLASVRLGGGPLVIEEQSGVEVTLRGVAQPVVLNGIPLTRSVWGSIPIEIKAVLIASLLAVVGWLWRSKLKHIRII